MKNNFDNIQDSFSNMEKTLVEWELVKGEDYEKTYEKLKAMLEKETEKIRMETV